MTRRTQIVAELESCKDRHGRITKEAIVAKAKSKRAAPALHDEFRRKGLWTDKTAAHKARLDFAGDLVRTYLTVTVINRSTKVKSVIYLHDPALPSNVGGYKDAQTFDKKSAELAIVQEIASCEAAIRRARGIAAVLDNRFPGLVEKLEDALQALVAARTEIRRAA